ncbi:MAG: helix-turn-helix domain-containing protein [Actinomycetota bacterium]|nr:helix-turn-helix domain-containing protein [Actinomycetota bacterium]
MSSEAAWSDLAEYLRGQRKLARLSLRHLAQLTSVSDSYLSQVERGLYQPSPEVLRAIAKALGIPVTALYERLGWLGPEDGHVPAAAPTGVEGAIEADPRLTAAQKAALLAMYRVLVTDERPRA